MLPTTVFAHLFSHTAGFKNSLRPWASWLPHESLSRAISLAMLTCCSLLKLWSWLPCLQTDSRRSHPGHLTDQAHWLVVLTVSPGCLHSGLEGCLLTLNRLLVDCLLRKVWLAVSGMLWLGASASV